MTKRNSGEKRKDQAEVNTCSDIDRGGIKSTALLFLKAALAPLWEAHVKTNGILS